jgi:hypothetical protein
MLENLNDEAEHATIVKGLIVIEQGICGQLIDEQPEADERFDIFLTFADNPIARSEKMNNAA